MKRMRSEPTEKQSICPEDNRANAETAVSTERKRDDEAESQEGFLSHGLQTPPKELGVVRCPQAPRRPAPTTRLPRPAPATMLLSVWHQPTVAQVPPTIRNRPDIVLHDGGLVIPIGSPPHSR
ncbi:hypothetical protein MRX96_034790 [Rhipicephalus microplus]